MAKFTVVRTNASAATSSIRQDLDMPQQHHMVAERQALLRRENLRRAAGNSVDKDSHRKMLLMLISEVNRYHAVDTRRLVSCPGVPEDSRPVPKPGLSLPTMKALVTDVDIVMNDEDKDNYQHALSAIAALALWQA